MGYGRVTRFETTPQYDIVSGDATGAYDGALTQALRSIVYLRPNLIVVHDRLASSTPRQWEWNIHALSRMRVHSPRRIEIESGGQRLCVEMLAGPEMGFGQTADWVADPTRGDGKVHASAAPAKGEPQWHGRFTTPPLAAAELVALLDVGCTKVATAASRDGAAWSLRVGERRIEIAPSGEIAVR
jgi:hypothetical protein